MRDIRKHRVDSVQREQAPELVGDRQRAFLIDWLSSIHASEMLKPETLHISVAILDKGLLQMNVVNSQQLYLIGLTALFIACKYEEVHTICTQDFCRLAVPHVINPSDVLMQEFNLLILNDFDLRVATSRRFFEIYANKVQASSIHRMLGEFFLELTLFEAEQLRANDDSLHAMAALLLAS